ncbi:hypothetical protein CEW83_04980 [Parazoarcus communis]|uniref:Uncharacterized protein n=1 Tax=Parazoarcus communis TaxID=41977 RepID=A0A2U8GNV6_9RHOO|nr:hypothetical protein [Parazoarcus communis]AWI74646.1 hypothetical protein CEW83_04980 [Parazoarcus communis]
MDKSPFTIEIAQTFHRRIASIVDRVQVGIWNVGTRDLLGFDSDFGFGQQHGFQSLVLKTCHRSTRLRLPWETLLGDSAEDRKSVDEAIENAIKALT